MPDPFDRHSKSKWEWGSEPARGQQRADAISDTPRKKRPPRKQPDACKGNHWDPHVYEVVKQAGTPCYWNAVLRFNKGSQVTCTPGWVCNHLRKCKFCGRIGESTDGAKFNWRSGHIKAEECPEYDAYVPMTVRKACAVKLLEYNERMERFRSKMRPKKPPINGPQGYRKRKK